MCTRKPNASSHKQRSSCDSFLSNFDHFHFYPQPPGNSSSPCHAIKCNHCCPAPRRKTRGCPIFLCGSTPGLPRSTTSSLSLRSSSYCCRGMLAGIHSEDAANEPPAPLVYLYTDGADGADASPVTDLVIGYFHRPEDLHEPVQTLTFYVGINPVWSYATFHTHTVEQLLWRNIGFFFNQ